MAFLLNHLLADSVRRYPDRPAVRFGSTCLTYRQLDLESTQLAYTLKTLGVRRGDRVGIYTDKSAHSVASLYGVLKAGGVYVPLDPKAPPLRLAYIIRNCGIRCLVTSPRKRCAVEQIFGESCGLDSVVLIEPSDGEEFGWPVPCVPHRAVLGRQETEAPPLHTISTDLAYILYTSGSTGSPKGVMISHLNALTFVDWGHKIFGVTADDVLSNHAPLHFDLSIFDIFVAARAGAVVVPVPENLAYFPVSLAEWIDQQEITIWYSVPSILAKLVAHGVLERFDFERLRTILFAGEVFPVKHLRQTILAFPNVAFFNLYGPTETNVITYYAVSQLADDRTTPIPIGLPCDNVEVFAIDERGEQVTQPGVEGELYARGTCVAQGYWGDPEKTGSVFLSDSRRDRCQDRIYRTGDIVRFDEEGLIHFVGRRDNLVKIRGYRVELGEIETVLHSHPDVLESAVVAVPGEAGNRIMAFLCAKRDTLLNEAGIKAYCARFLPRYMIPECVEFRDGLPQTATGKVDRKSLSASAQMPVGMHG